MDTIVKNLKLAGATRTRRGGELAPASLEGGRGEQLTKLYSREQQSTLLLLLSALLLLLLPQLNKLETMLKKMLPQTQEGEKVATVTVLERTRDYCLFLQQQVGQEFHILDFGKMIDYYSEAKYYR